MSSRLTRHWRVRISVGPTAMALLSISLPLVADAEPPASALTTKTAEAIKAIEREWVAASTTGNAAFIEQLLAPDYTDLSYDTPMSPVSIGRKEDSVKQAWQRRSSGALPVRQPTQRDLHVQIHGDIAIASGVAVFFAATP